MASLTTGLYSKSKLDESNFINVVSLVSFQRFKIHYSMKYYGFALFDPSKNINIGSFEQYEMDQMKWIIKKGVISSCDKTHMLTSYFEV